MENYTENQLFKLAMGCDNVVFMKYKYMNDVNESENIDFYSRFTLEKNVPLTLDMLPYDLSGQIEATVIHTDGKTYSREYGGAAIGLHDDAKVMVIILKVGVVDAANKWDVCELLLDKNCIGLDVFRYKYADGIEEDCNLKLLFMDDVQAFDVAFKSQNYDLRIYRDIDVNDLDSCYNGFNKRVVPQGKFIIALILPYFAPYR